MWGSDWPVLELDGSYTQWFSCILELITDLSAQEQKRILGETAREFYAIE
jgi:L-fuconolactonase